MGKKWLILIDELFKGTNVQDAMKCSTNVVIEGLAQNEEHAFHSFHAPVRDR